MDGQDIKKGTFDFYLKDISDLSCISEKEERELMKIKNSNIAAFNRIWLNNLKLVIFLAKLSKWQDIDFGDLVQAGNIGLNTAIIKFDPERKMKLSTYAVHWIRRMMIEEICSGRLIYIKEFGRKKIRETLKELNRIKEGETDLNNLKKREDLKRVLYDFSVQITYEEDLTLLKDVNFEFIDCESLSPEEALLFKEETKIANQKKQDFLIKLKNYLELPNIEQLINNEKSLKMFKMHYGLHDGSFKTMPLRKIGKIFGCLPGSVQFAVERIWLKLYEAGLLEESDRIYLYSILNIFRRNIQRKGQTHCVICGKKLADLNLYNKCFNCLKNHF